MTHDKLRAKFEAWMLSEGAFFDITGHMFLRDDEGEYIDSESFGAYLAYQAGHASRDAEVEALRRDAERYRCLRACSGYQAPFCVTQNIGHDWIIVRRDELDHAIDAAMREGGKE